MKTNLTGIASLCLACACAAPVLLGQGEESCGGSGGGGGGNGCGDLYGDLYVIARDQNGVPALVTYTIGEITYFAHQPLDANGAPIPLGPEGVPLLEEALVAVEFGRCNSMRAPSKVSKMHFDAVISAIQAADRVKLDAAGRLLLETDGVEAAIDSPPQNLALYKHLMKRGHLQTDPNALDDSHGTHAQPVYRPALREEDFDKFDNELRFLLPRDGRQCWDHNGNLDPSCLQPEPLSVDDLSMAASLLAAAADKTARITVDMVESLNGIMGITGPMDLFDPLDPTKTFFDYRQYTYRRTHAFREKVDALVPDGNGGYRVLDVDLLCWLHDVDPLLNYHVELTNVSAFVQRANDALRILEFLHNYGPPERLWNKTVFDAPLRFH